MTVHMHAIIIRVSLAANDLLDNDNLQIEVSNVQAGTMGDCVLSYEGTKSVTALGFDMYEQVTVPVLKCKRHSYGGGDGGIKFRADHPSALQQLQERLQADESLTLSPRIIRVSAECLLMRNAFDSIVDDMIAQAQMNPVALGWEARYLQRADSWLVEIKRWCDGMAGVAAAGTAKTALEALAQLCGETRSIVQVRYTIGCAFASYSVTASAMIIIVNFQSFDALQTVTLCW